MLTFLMILQLALEVSLQETPKSATSPQDWLQNACTLIMCGPNKGGPRTETAVQGLQQFSSPSELLANSAPNREKLGRETRELELLKLQVKELQIQMGILKATFINIQQAVLTPNGAIVDDKIFKRVDTKGDFQAAKNSCEYMGGNLALPRNVAENRALQTIVGWRKEQAILGITYRTTGNRFEDLNGQPLGFLNWAQGEPNNLGYEKCVEIHPDGYWHNRHCDLGWSIICEFKI
ncbi:pulmonary surfactant-associated protein D-like [Crotalus tigris]|uniref:pulmonary surfactant-associated protein D-like n=1 Tax=Crotalus tigris TaxID=88082 RepID=UPI00192F522D|nr:pulmonary surfactant-associated protein D-like [Crotalus tigris]XP_039196669.1 pulmonary surfactant-associated protein D-like [Crotalus tigris]